MESSETDMYNEAASLYPVLPGTRGHEEDRAMPVTGMEELERFRAQYPDKFLPDDEVFAHVRRGDRIFLGTACGEPQHLVQALTDYVKAHPKAFFDAEIMQVWTLGVAPYTDERLKSNFRLNAFFIGNNTRAAINSGLADYTPIFLSQVPGLFKRRILSVDIALIQTSLPDHHGFLSLGVSVDIVKAAAGSARLIIAQVNPQMPRVQGDGFLHLSEVDYVVPFDEPLLEYRPNVPDAIATRIGRYVARIVEDGDTIQVGYGSVPNAIMSALGRKKHLGVHTELLTDGLVDLIRKGVIDNSRKTIDQGKTVTSFCMGSRDAYDFIDGNPTIEFKTIDYTNDPVVIARQENMCAINSVLEIDLTGQATAESIGRSFYSGIGGQADFMRGAVLARGGKSILAIQSTAEEGKVSRIVPFLPEGAGATLNRGDVHYVVTEYGIAHIHGKNVRERAMDLIAIAHPAFRHQLVEEARKAHLVYGDQEFVPGERGEYPEHHETRKTTKTGLPLLLRPVKISDEPGAEGLLLLAVGPEHVPPLHDAAARHAARAAAGIRGHRLRARDGDPRVRRRGGAGAGGGAGRVLHRGGRPDGERGLRRHRPVPEQRRGHGTARPPDADRPPPGAPRLHGRGPARERSDAARVREDEVPGRDDDERGRVPAEDLAEIGIGDRGSGARDEGRGTRDQGRGTRDGTPTVTAQWPVVRDSV